MKLAHWTPRSNSGVADYAAALDRALARTHRGTTDHWPLYELGNNTLHREIYVRALTEPGVVILHDATLHHLLLGMLSEAEYVDEFVYNYGEWDRSLAQELWRRRRASASDERYFRYGMLRRIAERSVAVVVHNPEAARRVREAHAPARVVEVPHLFEPPSPLPVPRVLSADGFVFGVFGYLRESKRIASVLRAFSRLNGRASLVIQGDFVQATDYERSLDPLLAQRGVLRIPHLASEAEWWAYAAACDTAICLRYPSAGETSGIAIRMMGLGKAVIVSEGEEWSRYPPGSYWPIAAGDAREEDHLLEVMNWMVEHPSLAREMGLRAREHVRKVHDPDRVAGLLWPVLAKT